jgi:hypothetical protein
MDALCQAVIDRTLKVSLHTVNKAAAEAAFSKPTPNRPLTENT